MATSYAPVLLFVYNRPEHTRRLIESLQRNPLAGDSHLVIYSDYWKNTEDQPAVEEVRTYIRSVGGFASVNIIEQTENKGLAQSIITGVTTQIERFGRVIVLEDDLILAPHFLQFMNDALEAYTDEPRVGHIQACDFTQDPTLPDTFLVKWAGSWGWATWKRAWKLFNPNGQELLDQLYQRKQTRRFDFDGKYGYTRMLRRQVEGRNNSWAIRWNATLFVNDMLSLNVGKSLVQNNGFDGSGTHCGDDGLYAATLYQKEIQVEKICPIEENEQARTAISAYYARTNSFKSKAIRRIKKEIRKRWRPTK